MASALLEETPQVARAILEKSINAAASVGGAAGTWLARKERASPHAGKTLDCIWSDAERTELYR